MIYQANALQVQSLSDGIAQLTFNAKSAVNILSLDVLSELDQALDAIKAQTDITGLILDSDKDTFIVGANINEFLTIFAKPQPELEKWIIQANDIFNKLEDLPFPTISVLKGFTLGGGCECVLATDFRIADKTILIGLPETKLGIFPGFGGTVRLPRIIGADNAMELITSAKISKADTALKIGLIDAVVNTDALHESAINTLKQAQQHKLDWQSRRQQKLSPLSLSEIEIAMSFTTAKGMIAQIAGPHYPAPMASIKAIEEAAKLARTEALAVELKYFVNIAQGKVAQALVGLYLNDQYIKHIAKKASKKITPIQRAGVLGAGIMGGGIAYQSASKGVPVMMKDIAQPSLDLGMTEASKLLNKQLERGKINGLQMAKVLSNITPSLNYSGIELSDIIVEAVVENPKIKGAVLAELEQNVKDTTIIASNTSTIPINLLAKSLKRPENFCGMHFFNPVHRMPLVEIIRGKHTAESTIHKIVAYALQMGKSPIVVNDCPGFFVNRVLFPYFGGFSLLMRDGANFKQIDKVMERKFGWPMGPAYLLDVVGIDTAHHAQDVMAQGYPERMGKQGRDAIEALFEAKRFGQKNNKGFYAYEIDNKGKPKKVDDESVHTILEGISNAPQSFDDDTIINRIMIPMINEVLLCLEEKIVASPAEADMALVYGLGFPPFKGGACRYLDQMGLDNYIKLAEQYQSLGPMYKVPTLIYDMAKKGACFYPLPANSTSNN